MRSFVQLLNAWTRTISSTLTLLNPAVLARATCEGRSLSTFKPIAAQSSQCALALHRVKVSVWFYFKVIWATTVPRAIVCVMSNPKCARLTKQYILDEFDNPLSSDEEDCVAVDSGDGEVDHVEEDYPMKRCRNGAYFPFQPTGHE
ncbi:hypothetical protein J6590_081696 [Homalodisca vitripennis]|nr:hypothetical protein J6590_081696 [Homalodisca vitripennis]